MARILEFLTGYQVGETIQPTRKEAYLQIIKAILYAMILFFFFLESVNQPRMEAIAAFEHKLRGITQTRGSTTHYTVPYTGDGL